jgi:hypothetical protein
MSFDRAAGFFVSFVGIATGWARLPKATRI